MFKFPEKFSFADIAGMETMMSLASAAFASAERLTALNLNTGRSVLEESIANTKALLATKDPQEMMSLQAQLTQPFMEKVVAYSRSVYEISTQTQEEFSKAFAAQFADMNKTVVAALDEAAKSAPVGSDVAVAAVKSAIAAANSAYDSMTKAAKQVAEMTDTSVATATDAAVKAVGSAPAPKKAA